MNDKFSFRIQTCENAFTKPTVFLECSIIADSQKQADYFADELFKFWCKHKPTDVGLSTYNHTPCIFV